MRRNLARQGVSIVELLIAMAVFGLISSMIALLVRNGFTYMRQAQDRAELQRLSLFFLSNLSAEIAESSPDCIRYSDPGAPGPNAPDPSAPDPVKPWGIVYATPRGINNLVEYDNNRLVWKKWVAVWWDKDAGLILRSEAPLSSSTTFKPDPGPLGYNLSVASMQATGYDRRVLTRNVSDFSVEGDREVRISLQIEVNQGSRRSRLTTRTGIRPHH